MADRTWKPIATAPKRTVVRLRQTGKYQWFKITGARHGNDWYTTPWTWHMQPTHWAPVTEQADARS